MWAWFKANFAAIEKRLSSDNMAETTGILAGACTLEAKTEIQAFFAPRTKELTGSARTLAENKEKIGLCVAFKQAKGAEIASALHVHQ